MNACIVLISLMVVIIGPFCTISAETLWKADPVTLGTKSFGLLNLEGGATITVVDDPVYGKVFRCYHPSGSGRCETSHLPNGLHAKEGETWYIGWRFKLDMPIKTTTNAVFQWKAYPTDESQQNWPIVLKTINGSLTLIQRNPNNVVTTLWQSPTVVNTWISVVLCINVSRDIKTGYCEFYYNGQKQQFRNGQTRFICRTLDGDYTDPKWGIYGATGTVMTNYIHGNTIATTFDEANPDRQTAVQAPIPMNREIAYSVMRQYRDAQVFDLTGRLVAAAPLTTTPGVINVSCGTANGLAQGLYIIHHPRATRIAGSTVR